jgi:predicted dehydrogenase
MPDKSVLECRWGILGCGPEAASFVAELQSSSPSSSHSSPVVQHTIVAVSSRSISISQAFIDSHIRSTPSKASSSSTTTIEPFGTSTEIHAHPFIDSVFVASSQHSRYQEATSALRGGKSVLVSKPLAITSMEAKELCDLASRKDNSTTKWLGFIMRASSGKQPLLQAADECANGRAEGLIQSPLLPWSDSLAVLEVSTSHLD